VISKIIDDVVKCCFIRKGFIRLDFTRDC